MDLRHLRYFVAVAEEENIGRAAARLHISQPPLTRQIQQLEEEIGVSLFNRHAKGMSLTHQGHQFLRHLQRTHILLHIVDIAPFDPEADPVADAKAIVEELRKYDEALYNKPRWLVLNKLDLVPAEERAARVADFVKRFKWKGPVHEISALTHEGCKALIRDIYEHIHAEQRKEQPPAEIDPRFPDPSPSGEPGQPADSASSAPPAPRKPRTSKKTTG